MGTLLYSVTMSLDGFIAGPDGDMQWLTPYLESHPDIDGLPDRIGALLVGARTFWGDDPNAGTDSEGAFGGTWHGPQFVLTHRRPDHVPDGVTVLDDLGTAVSLAREAAGDRYVNVLGADVARQCLEAGELGEVLAIVAPVLLGDGTRLFDVPGGRQVALERTRTTQLPQATALWLRVV